MSCQKIFVSNMTPNGKRCYASKASHYSSNPTPLSEERTQIAEAAKLRAVAILRDAWRKKDRVLMEKPQDLVFGNSGDSKFWMERHAILTEELIERLISELEAVKFKEDLTKENTYAYVYPKSGDKTVYLCPLFWKASIYLKKDSQPGTLIHEVSHFLGIQDITCYEAIICVACRGKFAKLKVGSDMKPLEEALLNANNIEYEFEITLNHKGRFENGKYSCCGEKAENSVCARAVPDEFLTCNFQGSFPISTDIDVILTESLLPATERLKRHLDELREIADAIDKIHKGATIANVTGGAVGIAGGITTLAGLALMPFTFGASLILSFTGLAVSIAGGVTSVAATTTDLVASHVKKETVEKLLQECQVELENIKDYTERIAEKIQSLKDNENSGLVFAFSQIGSGAGQSVLSTIKIVEIGQLLAKVGRISKFVGAAMAILTVVIVGLEIFFVAKDSVELHKGAKTELAVKIREAVNEMEQVIGQVNEMCTALTADKQERILGKNKCPAFHRD